MRDLLKTVRLRPLCHFVRVGGGREAQKEGSYAGLSRLPDYVRDCSHALFHLGLQGFGSVHRSRKPRLMLKTEDRG